MPHSFPKGNVFSGARARFQIGGKYVGYATNCSGSEEIQYDAVEVLDHIQIVEYVPVGYRTTFTASRVRLIGSAAGTGGSLRGTMDAFPKLGNDDGEFLANILDMIQRGDMSCQIDDTVANKTFMLLEQVVIASRSWAITPRGIVGEDMTFLGIRMKDEAEVS